MLGPSVEGAHCPDLDLCQGNALIALIVRAMAAPESLPTTNQRSEKIKLWICLDSASNEPDGLKGSFLTIAGPIF